MIYNVQNKNKYKLIQLNNLIINSDKIINYQLNNY